MLWAETPGNVLVVAAHPDDELLGCGGTLVRLIEDGRQVGILVLGEGVTSRYPSRDMAPEAEIEDYRRRCRSVAEKLGVSFHRQGGLPDNRMDTVPLLEIAKVVETAIRDFAPAIVLTHQAGDLNQDHSLTLRATLIAARPLPGRVTRGVLAFETPSSTEVAFQNVSPAFQPNAFVALEACHFEKKLEALALYERELQPFPHPRSPEALLAVAKVRGVQVGVGLAEAYEQIWMRHG